MNITCNYDDINQYLFELLDLKAESIEYVYNIDLY